MSAKTYVALLCLLPTFVLAQDTLPDLFSNQSQPPTCKMFLEMSGEAARLTFAKTTVQAIAKVGFFERFWMNRFLSRRQNQATFGRLWKALQNVQVSPAFDQWLRDNLFTSEIDHNEIAKSDESTFNLGFLKDKFGESFAETNRLRRLGFYAFHATLTEAIRADSVVIINIKDLVTESGRILGEAYSGTMGVRIYLMVKAAKVEALVPSLRSLMTTKDKKKTILDLVSQGLVERAIWMNNDREPTMRYGASAGQFEFIDQDVFQKTAGWINTKMFYHANLKPDGLVPWIWQTNMDTLFYLATSWTGALTNANDALRLTK